MLELNSSSLTFSMFPCSQFGISYVLKLVSHFIVSKVRGQFETWQEWTVIVFVTSTPFFYSVKHFRNTNLSGVLRLFLFWISPSSLGGKTQAGSLNELIQVKKQSAFQNWYAYLELNSSLLFRHPPLSWPSLESKAFSDIYKWSTNISRRKHHLSTLFVYVLPFFWWVEILFTGQSAPNAKKWKILSRVVYKVMGMKGAAKISLMSSQQWSKRETLHAWFWRGISSQLILNIHFYFLK